ncbi:MAG: amidohydrolase family protein [Betaproteobacteria bacterium]
MANEKKSTVVALEEHYWDAELSRHFTTIGPEMRIPGLRERLYEVGALRIQEMDASGIDVQVLSHGSPAVQRLDAETAVPLARRVNDNLRAAIGQHPGRLEGFAVLPTADPLAAADELERCVIRLGFKGAMLHGLTGQHEFLDLKKFWPIYERAAALDVPIYLHPAVPHKAVVDAYYGDYLERYPSLATAAWGFTVEAGTQAIRMVLSGVFEAHPGLKIVLGHLGESVPFSAWRIDMGLRRPGSPSSAFRDVFRDRFWITTSGNFSTPALLCCLLEMGADRILFSVDYPYVANQPGVQWMQDLPVSPEDKEKILNGNAKKLMKLG